MKKMIGKKMKKLISEKLAYLDKETFIFLVCKGGG